MLPGLAPAGEYPKNTPLSRTDDPPLGAAEGIPRAPYRQRRLFQTVAPGHEQSLRRFAQSGRSLEILFGYRHDGDMYACAMKSLPGLRRLLLCRITDMAVILLAWQPVTVTCSPSYTASHPRNPANLLSNLRYAL